MIVFETGYKVLVIASSKGVVSKRNQVGILSVARRDEL